MLKRLVRRSLSPSVAAPLLALALALSGCARCGAPPAGPPPERFVPQGARGAVVVPELGALQREAAALYGTLLAMPGGGDLSLLRTALGAQLGFDPFDPASTEAAGIDPRRGAAISVVYGRSAQSMGLPVLIFGAADQGKVKALVARLARDRIGAGEAGTLTVEGRTLDVWRRAPGDPIQVTLAFSDGYAFLAGSPEGPPAVGEALALTPEASLLQSPAWKAARDAAGPGLSALLFSTHGAAGLGGSGFTSGAVLGLSATARSARLVLAGLLGDDEARLRPLAGTGAGKAGPLALDPDTVLAARLSASPAALLALLPEEAADPREAPIRAFLSELQPGVDVGISLSPKADLGGAVASRGAVDPFAVVRLELTGAVKDPAAAAARFDAIARQLGGEAKPGRWRLGDGPIRVEWALTGSALALAGGPAGGLEALQARAARKAPALAPPPAAFEALQGGLGGAALSGDNLVKGLKSLPPDAWGTGPDAVMTRSMVEKLATPTGKGGGLTVRADLPQGALRVALEVTLGEPTAK